MTPRWVRITTLALALAALAVSGWLTIAHYTSSKLFVCSGNGTIDCTRVTTSPQSRFLGIPVAVLGLAWALAMVVLCLPAAWRSTATWVRYARIGLAAAGVLFILWLIYAELFVIRAICLWCTAMHVITFGLFVVILLFGWAVEEGPEGRLA
jgi:uncharacterized membrane protein